MKLASQLFDQTWCGDLTLSVPLRHDIIQIGARDAPDQGSIQVRKRRRSVTVRRVGGNPLQVAILHQPEAAAEPAAHDAPSVSLVFHQPVQTLRLKRRWAGGWRIAGRRLNPTHPRHLEQLLDTIGAFAAAKQRAEAGCTVATEAR